MQQFPCPFCGLRDEQEFHYEGDFKHRPGLDCTDGEWAKYRHMNENLKGRDVSVWTHSGGCGLLFGMERDTVTHEVIRTFTLEDA